MGKRSRARALSVIFTCMLSSMLLGGRREEALLASTRLRILKAAGKLGMTGGGGGGGRGGSRVAYTQFLAARSLCITSLRDR